MKPAWLRLIHYIFLTILYNNWPCVWLLTLWGLDTRPPAPRDHTRLQKHASALITILSIPSIVQMSIFLPDTAALRIVLNPHSLPHVPSKLSDIVAHNRRETALCNLEQAAYFRRRAKWDDLRVKRIAQTQASSSAVDDDEDTDVDVPTGPVRISIARMRKTRSSSVVKNLYRITYPESHPQPPAPKIRRVSEGNHRALLLDIIDRIPETRSKRRCSQVRRPKPSIWCRRRSYTDQQPVWHMMLRKVYKDFGHEDIWRAQRLDFMQNFRRERLFNEQSKRRNTLV